jgi:hypothetical protein
MFVSQFINTRNERHAVLIIHNNLSPRSPRIYRLKPEKIWE